MRNVLLVFLFLFSLNAIGNESAFNYLSTSEMYQTSDLGTKLIKEHCFNENLKKSYNATYGDVLSYFKEYVINHFFYQGSENQKIRENVDHCFHGVYKKSRVEIQDKIVRKFINQEIRNDLNQEEKRQKVVFIAGPMGVGKGYVLKKLKKCNYFGNAPFTSIDFDIIKEEIPEYNNFEKIKKLTDGETEKAAFTHRESGLIGEIIFEKVLSVQGNLIVDGSLADYKWNYNQIKRLKRLGYQVEIIFVFADENSILERARERGKNGGRVISPDLLKKNIGKVKASYQFFSNKIEVDQFVSINNNKIPFIESLLKRNSQNQVEISKFTSEINNCLKE